MLEAYLNGLKTKRGFKIAKKIGIASAIIIPMLIMSALLLMILIGGSQGGDCSSQVSDLTSTGKVSGNWQDERSQAHQNMLKAVSFFKNKEGLSGDNIAAILAIGWRESSWDPTATNPAGSVVGIFQWGAGGVNGNRFGSTEKSLESELNLAHRELHSSHKAALVGLASAGTIDDSAAAWDVKFEGVGLGDPQRKVSDVLANANAIKKVFELNFAGHIDLNASDSTGISQLADNANSVTNLLSDCAGGADDTNGTGTDDIKGAWQPEQVPLAYRKYIHKVLSLANSKGDWLRVGGQCFDYSVSMAAKIWSGWGNNTMTTGHNAEQLAVDIGATFHTSVSNVPSAGAISSVPSVHTYIVEHVFANGDIFVSEQNMAKMSGDAIGQKCTYNYRVITKAQYKASGDTFAKGPGKLTWE
ncbi:phage tail tip lysozyme [Leuconostoc pseudomesenteroides]|uniref:phage tail tip lysozyme n=1 Tax=Leuconostoc pseudomesenteroides TaxID=33968 RepID=UPI0039E8FA43